MRSHILDLVPGMFCGFGVILIALSVLMQSSLASFGGAWTDFARGLGIILVMVVGILGVGAVAISMLVPR